MAKGSTALFSVKTRYLAAVCNYSVVLPLIGYCREPIESAALKGAGKCMCPSLGNIATNFGNWNKRRFRIFESEQREEQMVDLV